MKCRCNYKTGDMAIYSSDLSQRGTIRRCKQVVSIGVSAARANRVYTIKDVGKSPQDNAWPVKEPFYACRFLKAGPLYQVLFGDDNAT